MSNISQVKKESNWGDASTTINSNFQNLNTDLEKVKSSTTKFKGYFTSESSLKDKFPSPQSGDTAWVGEPYPGKVYDVQSGQWHNTNADPDTGSIELNDYVNKTEFEENKQQQDEKFTELENKTAGVNYVTCDTAAGTAAKTITVTGLTALTTGIRLLVKMTNVNTASNATLNINSLGAKPLYYDNERASSDNSWEAGEVIDIYYDGTNFYSSNVQGGSSAGGNQILDWTTDVATTRKLIPLKKRKKGLSITYVNNKNETVNEQYIKNVFTDTDWINDNNWVRYSMYKDARIREVRSGGFRCIGNLSIPSSKFGTGVLFPAKMLRDHRYAMYVETNFETKHFWVTVAGISAGDLYPLNDCNAQNGYMFEFTQNKYDYNSIVTVKDSAAELSEDSVCNIWIYDLDDTVTTALDRIGDIQLNQYPFNYKIIASLKKKIDVREFTAASKSLSFVLDLSKGNCGEQYLGGAGASYSKAVMLTNYNLRNDRKYLFQCYVSSGDAYMNYFYVDVQYNNGTYKNANGQDGIPSSSAAMYNAVFKPGFNYIYTPESEEESGLLTGFKFTFNRTLTPEKYEEYPVFDLVMSVYEIVDTIDELLKEQSIIKRIMQTLNITDTYEKKLVKVIELNEAINSTDLFIRVPFDFGFDINKDRAKVYMCKIKNNTNTPLQIGSVRPILKSTTGGFNAQKGLSCTIPTPLGGEFVFIAMQDMGTNGQASSADHIEFQVLNNSQWMNSVNATAEIYEIHAKSSIYDGLVDVTYSPDKHLPVGLTRVDISSELITVKSDHTLSGIPAKNVDFKYTFDTGKVFTCKADIDYQGASSINYPKKNLKIDLLDEEGESLELRIGTWLPMDGFHLKANWVDSTHCRNIIANRVMEQIYLSRGERPWDAYNDYSESDLLRRIDTGAIGHVDGFPIEIYINNEYVGLYTFNLNKHRSNFNMKKSNTKQIQIQMGVGMTWNTLPVKWSAMEIRNPKSDSGNEEFIEAKEPAEGEVKTAIERFATFCNGATLASPTFTKDDFKDYLNIPFWIDFILFCDFTGNWDGYTNNTMMCTWDGLHWSPLVYDLDSVFGAQGGGANDTYSYYYSPKGSSQQILNKIIEYYNDELIKRYVELRATGIFSVGNINKLINNFMVNIGEKGYEKEQEIWPNTPSNGGNTSYVWYDGKQRILSYVKGKILLMDLKYGLIQSRLYQ